MDSTQLTSVLQCPSCHAIDLISKDGEISCRECHSIYHIVDGIPQMVSPVKISSLKKEMIDFWGGGWTKRVQEDASIVSKERFLQEFGAMQLLQKIIGVKEIQAMESLKLLGKRVLEIGCGVGSSSIAFALDGAEVIASDLTKEAVTITAKKFRMLGIDGCVVQADAEHLPFRDSVFDVVFSSGVLHHTPDTQKAVDEIFRVVKPGGSAVVMLYAKWSGLYLIGLLLVRGILLGGIVRYGLRDWLGHLTEVAWHRGSKRLNPLTKVYSGRQMKNMFKKFNIINLWKHSFNWADIFPGIYRIIPRRKIKLGDTRLVIPSVLEVVLGRWAGFSLVVHAKKLASVEAQGLCQ